MNDLMLYSIAMLYLIFLLYTLHILYDWLYNHLLWIILIQSIKESEEKLTKSQKEYTKQQDLLNSRLVAIQEAGDTSYLDFILSSSSLTDLISNYYLVTELTTSDTELLEKIQKQKEEIEKAKIELESNKNELNIF